MKIDLLGLDYSKIEEIDVSEKILGLAFNEVIVKRSLEYQLSRSMSGNHKVKTSAEVSGSTRKPFRQKGTGSARQGNVRAPNLRGGGVSHGPVVRSHAISLPKKTRSLALRVALSQKYLLGRICIFKILDFQNCKTSAIENFLAKKNSVCFVLASQEKDKNLALSCRSLKNVKAVSYLALTMFDILKYNYIFFSMDSFFAFIKRFDSKYLEA